MNRYRGKKIGFFGDSITADGYYVDKLCKKLKCEGEIHAKNGATCANFWSYVNGTDSTYGCSDYSNFDAVLFMIGHNSGAGDETLESSGIKNIDNYENYPNTFYGYLCKSIEYVIAQNPGIKIYISGLHYSFKGDYKNSYETNLALKEIADYYNLPFINLIECGINKLNLSYYSTDNIHPNKNGSGELIAEYLYGQLISR